MGMETGECGESDFVLRQMAEDLHLQDYQEEVLHLLARQVGLVVSCPLISTCPFHSASSSSSWQKLLVTMVEKLVC